MSGVATWLFNSLILAAVLTASAAVLDLALRWAGRPVRWAWLAAAAGSVTLPWLLPMLPARVIPAAVADGVPLLMLDPLVVGGAAAAPGGSGWAASDVALLLWAAASLLMAVYVVRTVIELARARGAWRETELDGDRVYVARDTGPAALGVRRGVVVVPEWALQLRSEIRSLLLIHEREHVRAGDPRLLVAGLLLVAAMPWNPLVWYQLLRLRNAIELDCDARVLGGGADPRAYGALLLEVGRRRGSRSMVMAAFAEPRVFLHDRIARIAKWPVERRPVRAFAAGTVALLLFATALNARAPLKAITPVDDPTGTAAAAQSTGAETRIEDPVDTWATAPAPQPAPVHESDVRNDASSSGEAGPDPLGSPEVPLVPVTFTAEEVAARLAPSDTPRVPTYVPRTVEPALLNRAEVQRALEGSYPRMLREAGIGGAPTVWFRIDETGRVTDRRLNRTSGFEALDEAALAVAEVMRFSPAYNQSDAVAVWVEIPIRFNSGSSARGTTPADRAELERAAAQRRAELQQLARTSADAPQVTPVTVQPELVNRAEVQRALERGYPPMLRDAGISGTTAVWVHIDDTGYVGDTRIAQSSGYDEMDKAAQNVARVMSFSPARNGDDAVAAWIQIPIRFSSR